MSSPSNELAARMTAAYHAGEMERVVALGEQAARSDSTSEFIELLLGSAQQATGRINEAVATFRRLSQQRPDVSAYWNNLAVACRALGDLETAEQSSLTAIALAPHDAEVHYNLGLLYIQQRRWLLARESLMDAVDLAPAFIEARLQAAHACFVCGDNTGQEAMLAGAMHWPQQPAEQALMLSAMLSVQGDVTAALDALARALLPGGPDDDSLRLRIIARRIALLERSNQIPAAQIELPQLPLAALDALPPEADRARAEAWAAHAALAVRDGAYMEAADFYRRIVALAVDDESRAAASFGLASAYDKLGWPHDAWNAASTAHAAQLTVAREVVPELLAKDSQPLQMTSRIVSRIAYAGWTPLASPPTERSPIFVVGFPRSGTTLLEQMIDAHADFRSMDERAFIHELTERMALVGQHYPDDLAQLTQTEADHLRAAYFRMVAGVLPDLGARQLVDKNPLNMLCVPMIMRLFPEARIILCLRHPCDVLLSCSMQPFRSPAFMVLCSSLQRLARGYVQAFEQWHRHVEVFSPRVLAWRYESVVSDFENNVARLGQFLDVADASSMARFAEHARDKPYISTPSYAQVTQGIHRKAVNRWHAYREAFEPVLPMLRPMMETLGYDD
jgi:Flp pilus assembly protein TadD